MRSEHLMAALLALSLTGEARAGIAAPDFTATEARTIARNELLRAIIERDPWLVKRILSVMEGGKQRPGLGFTAPVDGVDARANPDLINSARTAESSVEWNELLRRARAQKEADAKQPPNLSRSSEGSVELMEMMRRARAAKQAQ
jgi:hypothetical protein